MSAICFPKRVFHYRSIVHRLLGFSVGEDDACTSVLIKSAALPPPAERQGEEAPLPRSWERLSVVVAGQEKGPMPPTTTVVWAAGLAVSACGVGVRPPRDSSQRGTGL